MEAYVLMNPVEAHRNIPRFSSVIQRCRFRFVSNRRRRRGIGRADRLDQVDPGDGRTDDRGDRRRNRRLLPPPRRRHITLLPPSTQPPEILPVQARHRSAELCAADAEHARRSTVRRKDPVEREALQRVALQQHHSRGGSRGSTGATT